jgi:hypothetical protein
VCITGGSGVRCLCLSCYLILLVQNWREYDVETVPEKNAWDLLGCGSLISNRLVIYLHDVLASLNGTWWNLRNRILLGENEKSGSND